jgi:REP element-mobilizing transposase RayT
MCYALGMARPLRIEFPGAVYHITARGNARQDIYLSDNDRRLFLATLSSTVEKYNWICHAFCLMDNHYHLLLETPDPNLSLGMRQLNGVYTQRFNRQHNRVGHVFQGRYKAILLEKQGHLLELCRYIVLNPVAAGIVNSPCDYHWSSYQPTAMAVNRPNFLHIDWILGQFADHKKEARELYRKFVTEGIAADQKRPWAKLVGQIILGDKSFVSRIQGTLADKKGIKEIPKTHRFPGRPSLTKLFPLRHRGDKKKRNAAIYAAHYAHGYTLKEIGDYLGIHYSTASRAAAEGKG